MDRSTTIYRNDNYEYPLNDDIENLKYMLLFETKCIVAIK